MDFASAITTEGFLEKQSPNLFKVYQSRYFAIRGKGQFLVWYKKKPTSPGQNPQGIINIDTISQIVQGQDKQFSIVYLQRTFNFKAQSSVVRQRWVNSLKTLLAHHTKINKNKVKMSDNTVQSWKWKSNSNQTINQLIRIENQEAILQDTEGEKLKMNQGLLAAILKDKNVGEIYKCIVYGFFTKKKLFGSSERWYFMASGVNLRDQKDEEMYNSTQELLESLQSPLNQPKKQQQKVDNSSSQQQQQKAVVNQKKSKKLKINSLFEYDPENRQIKHIYDLIDVVSFEIKTSEQPFQLKINYQEIINQEEEEIKENQIVLCSNFLVEIKKLYTAIKIVNQKYNMQKQREQKNANKSKRYPAKKWKYVNEDQWRVPQQKSSLYILLNKKMMRVNALIINLEEITSNNRQSISIPIPSANEQSKQKQKKQDALLIVYKKEKEQFKIYIQFDKTETMMKFIKKLNRNMKKMQEQKQTENATKLMSKKQEQKQSNQETYLIDKKIRETNSSIKVNFYQMMDREIIQQKKQDPNQGKGFFLKFKAMLCAAPMNFYNDVSS